MTVENAALLEPWLRGTLAEVGAVHRGVLHALQLAEEDVTKWCGTLTNSEINQKLYGLPSVAYHLRHIARSLDRLLTYAEGELLSSEQMTALKSEADVGAMRQAVFDEFRRAFDASAQRVRTLVIVDVNQPRGVGRKQLPTSVGGLLVHIADHTQRHVGQAITTAKFLVAVRTQGEHSEP